jgi:hypothetical protein
MKSLRQLCFALVLILALVGTALAGDMNSPPAPAPGDMNSPPAAAPGDMNSPPLAAQSEIGMRGIAQEMQHPGTISFLFLLLGF